MPHWCRRLHISKLLPLEAILLHNLEEELILSTLCERVGIRQISLLFAAQGFPDLQPVLLVTPARASLKVFKLQRSGSAAPNFSSKGWMAR